MEERAVESFRASVFAGVAAAGSSTTAALRTRNTASSSNARHAPFKHLIGAFLHVAADGEGLIHCSSRRESALTLHVGNAKRIQSRLTLAATLGSTAQKQVAVSVALHRVEQRVFGLPLLLHGFGFIQMPGLVQGIGCLTNGLPRGESE